MRLAHRTGLAAFAAATLSLLGIAAVFNRQFNQVLIDRVDAQLEERADTAPILAAIGSRLARSELSGTVQPARVITGAEPGGTVEMGQLPSDPLPLPSGPGWRTETADGQRWRLYTINVVDVPAIGDESLVQLVAPLGDVEAEAQRLRRQATTVSLLAAVGAGAVGYLLGSLASRPMTALRRDTGHLDDAKPDQWRVADSYGTPEVDGVAATLNTTLGRLADETERRGRALATARSFASTANHELRVPLQGALTNLNLAVDPRLPPEEQHEVLDLAASQLRRMAESLGAVRALAEAELADTTWFEPADLAELVDRAVADETRRATATIELAVAPPGRADHGPGEDQPRPLLWADGVRLAVANVVRNALVHGRRSPAAEVGIVVTIGHDPATVTVDDDGPGLPPGEDRERLLRRFERGGGDRGTGLGLAIAQQVSTAHGGSVELADSPSGGARVVLRFGPPPTAPRPGPVAHDSSATAQ